MGPSRDRVTGVPSVDNFSEQANPRRAHRILRSWMGRRWLQRDWLVLARIGIASQTVDFGESTRARIEPSLAAAMIASV